MNVVEIARDLGITRALVPRSAGTLSAVGAQMADLVAEFSRSQVTSTADFDWPRAERTLTELDGEVDAFLGDAGRSIDRDALVRQYFVEGRYPEQVWDLRVPIEWAGGPLGPRTIDASIRAFHDLHQRTFAVSDETQPVEYQNWIARVVISLPKPSPRIAVEAAGESPRHRDVWFDGSALSAQCIHGSTLAPGTILEGPAIIEEATTTVVLPPAARAEVTNLGSYLIDTGAEST
jgi:N-methylhydantoinase A